jgi:uncharacterized phage-associated protein
MKKGYTKDELDKLGNAIIFLAGKIKPLSKTKLMKLIYLMDELSVKKYGIPFFDLEYKVWQAGPVNVDLFSELSEGPELLCDFIHLTYKNGECYVTVKKEFNDSEFSDNELKLLETVVTTYGGFSAKKLVELCHRTTTLWYKAAKENDVLDSFENKKLTTTDIILDLSEYIKEDALKYSVYNNHREFLNFSRRFKT